MLTRLPPDGDAEKFVLTGDGYEHRFIVSNAQMATDEHAVAKAIRQAMDRYRKAATNG
jgi:nicotinate-nucleotide pyrophosphorylase